MNFTPKAGEEALYVSRRSALAPTVRVELLRRVKHADGIWWWQCRVLEGASKGLEIEVHPDWLEPKEEA